MKNLWRELEYLWDDVEEYVIPALIIGALVLAVTLTWNLTAYRDVEELKETAPIFIETRGFCDIVESGFTGSVLAGGAVWYLAKDEAGYRYKISVSEWREALQLASIECLNQ